MASMNAHNDHHHKYYYQILKLLLIAALLVVTPLLSSSSQSKKYLYFIIVNILIIAVGAEAGLVSFFLRSGETKKAYFPAKENNKYLSITSDDHDESDNGARPVNRVFVEAVNVDMAKEVEKILLPPSSSSNPSMFFVGGGESENINNNNIIISQVADQELLIMEDDDNEEILFQKAEMFIGNFYKQLKLQRDESRGRLIS
ncbi:hypothetical protein CASFOL_019054 [Castilleja foliolosa]|uniref:Uncharacterized protein n=1 Tax=Castilleja foliolosa TaxID=1961234 RepID=A0ABD3D3B1_9LAMI